jgi:peptidoglycan/xylan/chitin deacetylase (PgdA/CDA1 family)
MSEIFLNFHGIGPIPRPLDPGERNCWLEYEHFAAVLDLVQGQPHVRLTFDDGNTSDVDCALPALRRRNLKAAFFVCSGRVDRPTFLHREQILTLKAEGMDIGSHGFAHVSWRHLPPVQFRQETQDSRNLLEQICNASVDTAACPFGSYDRHVLAGLRRAGYRRVFTSDGGRATEGQWLCARTTITRSTRLDEIAALVRAGPSFWRQTTISGRTLLKRFRG